jgi:hypothetical protein
MNRSFHCLLLGASLVLALLVRGFAAQGSLWLDEIWSLTLVEGLSNPFAALYAPFHDNAHPLNSLVLAFAGKEAPPLILRLLSVFSGGLAVLIAAVLVRREGSLVAALIFALSWPLIDIGSQARGYAPLLAFALLAILAVQRLQETPLWRWVLGGAAFLGLLSHLAMLPVLGALLLWCLRPLVLSPRTWRQDVDGLLPYLLPLLAGMVGAFLLYVLGAAKGIVIGGVHPFEAQAFWQAYGTLLQLGFGLPVTPVFWINTVLMAGLAGWLLWQIRTQLSPLLLFLAFVLAIIFPALIFLLKIPNSAFPRYFLIALLPLLLVLAHSLERALQGTAKQRLVAQFICGLFLGGQLFLLSGFFAQGREQPREALAVMAQSPGRSYGADHETRYHMVLDFLQRHDSMPLSQRPRESWCNAPPGWLLLDPQDRRRTAEKTLLVETCRLCYRHEQTFLTFPLSGWPWALYRYTPQGCEETEKGT